MERLRKVRLNRRIALISPDGEIYMAPFFEDGVPEGVYILYISHSGLTAVVAARKGWRALPVVFPDRVFAGRIVHPVSGGDEVVVALPEGRRVFPVEETPEGIGVAGGVYIPLWREVSGAIMAPHPSGLWVDRFNNLFEEEEGEPSATPSDSESEDDV